ncbi:MAG: hypothetical protein QOD92_1517 [Acidimicrobiaceae bacterium]|jgi:hypothetical protein
MADDNPETLVVRLVPDEAADFAGAKVSATPQTGSVVTGDVGADGKATLKVAAGTYTIALATAPAGMFAIATPSVSVVAGTAATVDLPLVHGGTITLVVTNDEPKPLEGAVFSVRKGETSVSELITGADGRVTSVPLAPGSYVVKEMKVPAGHLASPDEPVTLVAKDAQTFSLRNDRAASLVIKVLEDGTTKGGLAGASVVISGPNEYEATVTTEAPETTHAGLRAGEYKLEERTAPASFTREEGQWVVTLGRGESKDVTFHNARVTPTAQSSSTIGFDVSRVVVIGLVVLALYQFRQHRWDYVSAAAVLVIGLGLLTFIGGKPRGMFQPLVGGDGRISTSKVQVGIWTVAVVWGLAFLAGRVTFAEDLPKDQQPATVANAADATTVTKAAATPDGATPTTDNVVGDTIDEVIPNDRWDDYLILLGGPFAAAVLAKGVVKRRIDNGTLQKTVDDAGQTKIDQIFKDDAGQSDLVDSQYLLFNVVALGYFVAQLAQHPVLPQMPSTLLALTSGAAAVYVGNKAVESNPPTITSVVPASVRPAETLTISGQNFLPSGTRPDQHATVDLDGVGPLRVTSESDSSLQAVVSPGVAASTKNLTVTTSLGVATEVWPVRIEDDQARVVGVSGGLAKRGEPLRLIGRNFRSPADPGAQQAIVFINDVATPGTVETLGDGLEQVTVPAPDIPAGATQILVAVQSSMGVKSAVISIPVAQ